VPGLTGATSSTFNITVGTANKLAFSQQPTNTQAGSPIAPAVMVQVQDQFGNLVSSDASNVSITISSGGAFSGGSTTTVAAASGVATFSNLVPTVAGTFTLAASDGPLTGATSNSFTVNPGALSHFVFATISSPQTAGTAFNIAVTAEDANGNTVTSFSGNGNKVMLSSTGTLVGAPITTASFTNGVLSSQSVTITNTGSFTITATGIGPNSGVIGTSNSFTVNPGAASKLVFTTEPSSSVTAGTAFTQQPAATIEDQFGNTVTGSSAPVTLAVTTGTGTAGATVTCTYADSTVSAGA
jgi:hypothetical protein